MVIRLTKAGRARAHEVLQARARVTNTALAGLPAAQCETLQPGLETALATLTQGKDGARRICRLCDERVCRPKGCPVELAAGAEGSRAPS